MEVKVLTVKETAELLKTSSQQVRKMIREDIMPAVKVGSTEKHEQWRGNTENGKERRANAPAYGRRSWQG